MSTRAQIEFKHIRKFFGRKKPIISRRTVYRHSDGYPDTECGVIADLVSFLKWNNGRNSDIEYQTANFIYWSKRWHEELYFNKIWNRTDKSKVKDINAKWHDVENTNVSNLHTGFGICENDGFHGDIEYFYEVVYEVIETEKNMYEEKTYINVYNVEQKDYSKPVTRKSLKLITEFDVSKTQEISKTDLLMN